MLRDYQLDAIEKVRRAARDGAKAVCLVMPTGAGKTRTCGEIVRLATSKGKSALWVAHRAELVDQAVDALAVLGVRAGAVCASAVSPPQPHLPVQVATVQTLLARGVRPPADIIVTDESHHYAAKTFLALVREYPEALIIGPTATPERGDGKGLGELFDTIVVGTSVRRLVELGHLVPANLIRPPRKLRTGEIARRPVDAYLEHAARRRAIVFSPLIDEAKRHVVEFREAGLRAELVTGETAWSERRKAFADLGGGNLDALVNVNVATEGFDVPSTDCVILARNFGSAGGYIQAVGRGLRTSPATGKRDAVIIDLAGTSHVHGHPEDDRVFALDGRGITSASSSFVSGFCAVCGAPLPEEGPCLSCGIDRGREEQRVVNERLEPYAAKRAEAPDQRIATLMRWITVQRSKGYKTSWSAVKYKAVYGEWPPLAIRNAAEAMIDGRPVAP
jgi:DNA repair protein RadD